MVLYCLYSIAKRQPWFYFPFDEIVLISCLIRIVASQKHKQTTYALKSTITGCLKKHELKESFKTSVV